MKPISFLCSSWRKKENKSSGAQPTVEPFLLEPPLGSPLLKSDFIERASVLSVEFESTFQDSKVADLVVNGAEGLGYLHSQIVPSLRGKHGTLFQSAGHGPPDNTFHGPTALSFGGRHSRHKIPPRRPPRPPSLNLHSQPPSPLPRSPARVKFAPEPDIRAERPSSSRQNYRQMARHHQTSTSPDVVEVASGQEMRGDEDPRASHYPLRSNALFPSPPMVESASTARAVLDLSPSSLKTFKRATSSSPHLPLRDMRPQTEPQTQLGGSRTSQGNVSVSSPSPLRGRRRPRPLVLLPAPTEARLSHSPMASSTDSTPLPTPTLSGMLSSPKSPKFMGRSHRTRSPPRFSPPNSPLPTPPTSSSLLSPPEHNNLRIRGKQLRTTQSTSILRDYQPELPYQAHRSTSSTPGPSPSAFLTVNEPRRRVDSTPSPTSDSRYLPLNPHERQRTADENARDDDQIVWGYAL